MDPKLLTTEQLTSLFSTTLHNFENIQRFAFVDYYWDRSVFRLGKQILRPDFREVLNALLISSNASGRRIKNLSRVPFNVVHNALEIDDILTTLHQNSSLSMLSSISLRFRFPYNELRPNDFDAAEFGSRLATSLNCMSSLKSLGLELRDYES